MLEKIKKFREYLDYIERHYNNVQKAWALINEKCPNIFKFISDDYVWHSIDQAVKNHDLSKLSESEFCQYRQYFFPCEGEVKDKELFLSAWEHHKEKNPHHWQNWTKNYPKHPYVEVFFIENLIDWIAMGFEFNDTALNYYEKNKKDINLPEWAVNDMYEIFSFVYPKS